MPQLFVDVDQEKVLQQQVQLSDVYTTMSTFMGGYLVNYFNRFGRQWQTYVEAKGTSRTDIKNISQFYVRSANGGQVPLASLVKVKQITGPEYIFRFNEFNAAQVNIAGKPGYSSGQIRAALEKTFAEVMPPGAGFDYSGNVVSGAVKRRRACQRGRCSGFRYCLCFLFWLRCMRAGRCLSVCC